MYAWLSIVGGWKVLFDNEIVGGEGREREDLNSRCLCWKHQKMWVELQSYTGSWRGMWWWVGIGEKVRKLKDNWLPTPTSFVVTFPCKFLKEDACVSELLDHAFVWKPNLVDVIFLFHKAALIKCLPLSKWHSHLDRYCKDALWWRVLCDANRRTLAKLSRGELLYCMERQHKMWNKIEQWGELWSLQWTLEAESESTSIIAGLQAKESSHSSFGHFMSEFVWACFKDI